jgi:predicted esterase
MLHGAGGSATQVLPMVRDAAERHGVLVLAPDARDATWDVIRGGYGPDVAFVDLALGQVFATYAIDPGRIAVGGFSDGASYALSLGLGNGGLLGHVLAFSPGFAAPAEVHGTPRIFLSHGRADKVLPIERCGRRLARELRRAGYDLDYREFAGGHLMPPDLVEAAFARFMGQEDRATR